LRFSIAKLKVVGSKPIIRSALHASSSRASARNVVRGAAGTPGSAADFAQILGGRMPRAYRIETQMFLIPGVIARLWEISLSRRQRSQDALEAAACRIVLQQLELCRDGVVLFLVL